MIAGCDRRDGWVGPSSELETDCERALVGYGTCSTRAKWRSSRSACSSALQKELDTADIVRDGDLTSITSQASLRRTIKTAMRLHSGIGSGSLAGVYPDSLVPALATITQLAVQVRFNERNGDFSPTIGGKTGSYVPYLFQSSFLISRAPNSRAPSSNKKIPITASIIQRLSRWRSPAQTRADTKKPITANKETK